MIYTKQFVKCTRCGREEVMKHDRYPWKDLPNDLHVCPSCISAYFEMKQTIKRAEDRFWGEV